MPTGKKVSDEKEEVILRLHNMGLTPQQIAPQVGLHPGGVYKLIQRRTQKGGSRNGESKTGNNGGRG